MLFGRLWQVACLAHSVAGLAMPNLMNRPAALMKRYQNDGLQDIVTWDEHSLFVRGERVLFYSGEFHPFRLPVPSLWLDIFQKIKALGYNGVSFYTDWALLEGKHGVFNASGIFDLGPFFEAASEAGIYLLARPGPYINAEASGGGYPGWLQRNPGLLRTRDPRYEHATDNYVNHISAIIAKAQITNGGPVILLQPENEYSQGFVPEFPDPVYFGYVEQQYRNNSIVVPLISNDAAPRGYFAPGKPAAVDIYGHDSYPLGFDCASPYTWPDGDLPTNFLTLHREQSPSTPYAIVEFQGGSFDPWGGSGFDKCTALLGPQFERVFYKNDFSFGVTIFNIYMTYGGTNWGNLGHPGGYTSYDYGAVIDEERTVTREKYSEAKLEANFLQASPAYLTAIAQNNTHANGSYTGDSALAVTALFGNTTNFFVIRHTAYNSLDTTSYSITLPTSQGNITIPQLNGSLSLVGRDSKFHVTDYDLGGINLLYSTAEIFTWKQYGSQRVLVVYGGPGELHELAVSNSTRQSWVNDSQRGDGGDAQPQVIEGSGVRLGNKNGATVLQYTASSERKVVSVGELTIYLLDRYSAYDYWTVSLPDDSISGNYTNATYFSSAAIVKAGYLLRTAEISGSSIHLTGDLNATTEIEVVGGAPAHTTQLTWNGEALPFKQSESGAVTATASYNVPSFTIPDLSTVEWKVFDSLPEIQPGYDDSLWTEATLTYSNNTARNLTTPRSLYASDYGYHTGNLLYRGHFTATGNESTFFLSTQGGTAYGHSLWLNATFLGSFYGADQYKAWNDTYPLPTLTPGTPYVLTLLLDTMGLDENGDAGSSSMKNPRGILDYRLAGHRPRDIAWKLTGNLGGEDYATAPAAPSTKAASPPNATATTS
ncbi:glycoside hydrolase family 35 protein, partial [Teratosphaeria destructans]